MSFLACHMWSVGCVLAFGAAWGLFRAMVFQSPHSHLLDQWPPLPPIELSWLQLGQRGPETLPHPGVFHSFMHMDTEVAGAYVALTLA